MLNRRGSVSALGLTAAAAVMGAGIMFFLMRQREQSKLLTSEEEEREDEDDEEDQFDDETAYAADRNRLNPALQMAGRAKVSRRAQTFYRDQPHSTHVIRIALTGGPCAGKSSALAHLREKATAEGFDVICAPEIATMIFNSGVMFPTNAKEEYLFQRSVCSLQLAMERNFTFIIQATGRPSIIIYDRGMLDTKAFVSTETWEKILSDMTTGSGEFEEDGMSGEEAVKGITEEYCLKRYDGVVHLVTAADGAAKFFKTGAATDDSGKEVLRRESPEQAIDMDRKIQDAYKQHPRHHVIKNEGSFQQKLEKTTDVILNLARESHPWEYKRAGTMRNVLAAE